jgi:hypothetical protein
MAQNFSRHQQGIVKRYYEHQDTIRSNRLSELVSELAVCESPSAATKLWGRAQVDLMRAGADATKVAAIVAQRDLEGLAKLVLQLDQGGSAAASAQSPAAPPPAPATAPAPAAMAELPYDSLEEGNLKRAMNAFRKRMKVMKRDDESQIRGRYVTRGESSSIAAITPPREFPAAVWEELARQGRLKRAGQGTYQLA